MNEDEAFCFAIRSLSRRSQLADELKRKLHERGASQEVIEAIVRRLIEHGYLNDQDVVQERVKKEIRKGLAPRAIRQKLWNVPKEFVEEALASHAPSPQESIRHLIETKYARLDLDDPKQKKRLIAALLRRGFRYEDVVALIK